MRKLFLTLMPLLFFYGSMIGPSVSANELVSPPENVEMQTEVMLYNLTPALTRGTSLPTANWNVASSGRNTMSGTYSGGYYLYSNYNILGKNTYNYYFHNQGRGTLEIRMRNSVNHAVLKTHFVSSGSTITSSLNMTDRNSRFYYEFYSTVDYVFSGYVQ
ncbi:MULTISPECIES: hypothetical protein [unclassified Enterococcus]|uniref:hypothetical protein n=1 Tax=unclassified Enterococcus TaxID=2608891 RepID=UPI001A937D3E|nr:MULTISPECIES: hypothetical protein [unclassified Enterococcus]MBO0462149.1 hypothetical protein [Enterococcus sp. DIV1298c]MBO1300167.1 hypothetical protein [Enterococcus sp. DIV1271a]